MKTNVWDNPKADLSSSIVVFLVALPLCLGIALASGAPLLSGLIAGVVGGLLVGFFSGSHTSVSGPAAGMAAVVLAAIAKLGSFEVFLLSLVLAGTFQWIGGFLKVGFIARYIPSNVIKGLLAAVGVILILKQIPHAVGFDVGTEGDFSFFQKDGENTFSELLKAADFFTIGAIAISFISIPILIYWDKTPLKKLTFFPPSLFVVILGILLNWLFYNYVPFFSLNPEHLVEIPRIENVMSLITLPRFESITNPQVWFVAVTLAIVASLETLVNLEATDNLDSLKRVSSPNRELIAQGLGNVACGLIGGLPITSVVVRSSVNINAGAHSKLSTIIHGALLLTSVLILSPVMNHIPLASLAAVLLVAGYRLANVRLFKEMYAKGLNQFIPFVATVVAIVFTDLLTGIIIGSGISIFYLLKSNLQNPFTVEEEKMHIGDTMRIIFANQVTFLNKASVKEALWKIPRNEKVVIDATQCNFIDHDVVEIIHDVMNTVAKKKNIQTNILGLAGFSDDEEEAHIEFSSVLDKESRKKLTPGEILDLLKKGSERFMSGKQSKKYFNLQIHDSASGQSPMAVILSCIDSRTSPELIFDAGLGDIISVRVAGNIMSDEILGSIEMACKEIGTKLVVVLGHSNCGAVGAAIHSLGSGHMSHITNKIEASVLKVSTDRSKITADISLMNMVTMNNIKNSLDAIKTESAYLRDRIQSTEIGIVAAFYDTAQGTVVFDEMQ